MKITNWKDCIRDRSNGRHSLRRPKLPWSCSALERRRRRWEDNIKKNIREICYAKHTIYVSEVN
jgi:hypothetical protein